MTSVYAESSVVIGPLAPVHEPGSYDLCEAHAAAMSAPRGWEIVRLPGSFGPLPVSDDDLEALANEVRRVGLEAEAPYRPPLARRKGHLAVVADL